MSNEAITEITTTCCVVGGGPAGMMTGFLLARAGIDVVVLEKHGDFLRDFRGDTVHPSTLQLMHELGFLEEFLQRPHTQEHALGAQFGDQFVGLADFSYLRTKCRFIAFMPQWDFLNFLCEKAQRYLSFTLKLNTEVIDLIEENGTIAGVKAKSKDGELHIRAKLTIGADGRSSIVRERAGFEIEDLGAPMDVLWLRLSRKETDPKQVLGRISAGVILIMLNRDQYWQCGFVIPKGNLDQLKAEGLDKFRKRLTAVAPFVADRVKEVKSWDDLKLLTVKLDRLKKWHRQGLLCIGDSAHAMSPIGGVGINLAIQDAVATANILFHPLLNGYLIETHLRNVQERRMFPTVMTQRLQALIQRKFVQRTLASNKPIAMPWLAGLFSRFPILRAIPAHVIGIGFRAEHIHSPDRDENL